MEAPDAPGATEMVAPWWWSTLKPGITATDQPALPSRKAQIEVLAVEADS